MIKKVKYSAAKAEQGLRPYQEEALAKLARMHQEASGYENMLLVQLPTGSGKTRVANVFLRDEIFTAKSKKKVLWIAPNSWLLEQACKELIEITPDIFPQIRRFGTIDGLKGLAQLGPDNPGQDWRICYVTNGKIANNRSINIEFLFAQKFDYIIIDEVHYGVGKNAHGKIKEQLKAPGGREPIFIGLSATLKAQNKGLPVTRYLYGDLIKLAPSVLSECDYHQVETGIRLRTKDWGASLGKNITKAIKEVERAAMNSPRRNDLIAKHWNPSFGKTLVFSINKLHAEDLGRAFRRAHPAVPVDVVHSDYGDAAAKIAAFRFNQTKILINVDQLSHGIDIADIETIFLSRPTTSDIRFTQMVGRGSRLILPDGRLKPSFRVEDFTDNLGDKRLHKIFYSQEKGHIFEGAKSAVGQAEESLIRMDQSDRSTILPYDPLSAMGEVGDAYPVHLSDIKGFPLRPKQPFGIEIEMTHDGVKRTEPVLPGREFNALVRHFADRLAAKLEGDDRRKRVNRSPILGGDQREYDKWNIEHDNSFGLKIISPVLEGERGLNELAIALPVIREAAADAGVRIDESTGLNLHFQWKFNSYDHGFQFLRLVHAVEPAIPARENPACRTVRQELDRSLLGSAGASGDYKAVFRKLFAFDNFKRDLAEPKYLALNFENLFGGIGIVDIRYHRATLDFKAVAGWISFWMSLIAASDKIETPRAADQTSVAAFLSQGLNLPGSPLVRHFEGAKTASTSDRPAGQSWTPT